MKVQLKKKMLKRLVNNDEKLDQHATPLIAGGFGSNYGTGGNGGNGTCNPRGTVANQPHETISDVGITF
ncbi:hypothetical protein ACSLBF_09570 [Pseudoalteromonas sp. T1lg65]|uniref:hypothetical protein n=1 Tax=Pseudoalteromonas sp. T1lg65 TaxID=2077101 RepID=UPI003F7AD19E